MTIAEALRAAALYVEQHKADLAWDGPEMPSDEEKAPIIAEVSAFGHDLDGLAAASETAPVYLREYETIKGDLQRRGFFMSSEIAQAVSGAFQADRVAKARPRKGEGVGGDDAEDDPGRIWRCAELALKTQFSCPMPRSRSEFR